MTITNAASATTVTNAASATTITNAASAATATVPSDQELLIELDDVEQAITATATFSCTVDAEGRETVRVSAAPVAWAMREHQLVTELRRRHLLHPAPPVPAGTVWSW